MNKLSWLSADFAVGGLDWGVDGRPLGEWLARWVKEPVLRLGRGGLLPTHAAEDFLLLAGQGDRIAELYPEDPGYPLRLPSGRVPLYRCSQCGDLNCGAFAVRVTFDADTVTWSDFTSFDTEYEPQLEPDPDFERVPQARFDRADYLSVVRQIRTFDTPGLRRR
ncbi:MAG: hypothetical protein LBC97_04955 [Bifidobacteriaceae bacterium]|nr:hypothetical protein [Bifidobacteriaceae bacterium]